MGDDKTKNDMILDEEKISDILLCEPITRKGIASLDRLGIGTDEITPRYYYDNIRVPSRYDKENGYDNINVVNTHDANCLYYQYTVDRLQFEYIQNQWKRFDNRFYGNQVCGYPLLMLGVAGNGKSIEINRRIYKISSNDTSSEPSSVYLDLDEAFTAITYGEEYRCPSEKPCWLFCIKLIDGIMNYIRACDTKCYEIRNNFYELIVRKNLAINEQKELFDKIGEFSKDDNDTETQIFHSIKGFLKSKEGEQEHDIQKLIEVLMLIMFCSNPRKKHYIVIDNIEEYIKLNQLKVQIADSDIRSLNRIINSVVTNMSNYYNRVERELVWRAFKIIIVLRRTTLGLLDRSRLHAPIRNEQNITDITGYFQLPDIWVKKKKYIWIDRMEKNCSSGENNIIINIVDCIMNDGRQSLGISYQTLIAPLMSYGIRRNAMAQAHASYSTYKMLTNGDKETIGYDEFEHIMLGKNVGSSSRYMFRRALVEFQFKWAISSDNHDRWKKLGIGHLTCEKDCNYNGKIFRVQEVGYYDNCVTLVRRILTYLSYFSVNDSYVSGQRKTVADMFMTRSLYDLVSGVMINPIESNTIDKDDYLQFARVLIALSDMSNEDTKSAPYVILGVNNTEFNESTDESVLADILEKIIEAGSEESKQGKKYDCGDYGARINDAGNAFLLDWQASFSFMASLHCFTIPSLFFLKDITAIKYVIETVYNVSDDLCKKYEQEAARFCGLGVSLNDAKYLPKQNNQYITFRQRVRDLHIAHLNLYSDYLDKSYKQLGIEEPVMHDLKDNYIKNYIDKYRVWNTSRGGYQCF